MTHANAPAQPLQQVPCALPWGAVDCHAHVMKVGAPLAAERHNEPARDVGVDEYLRALDHHGVTFGVLTAPGFYGTDNSLLLAALAEAAGRLRGTAIVDPAIAPDRLAALHGAGIEGIRLNFSQRKVLPDVSGADWGRLFGLVRDLGMHVELFVEGELLPRLMPALLQSRASIVIDHFGCPPPQDGVRSEAFQCLLGAMGQGRTWVKLSAPFRLRGADPQPYVDVLLDAAGPQRLVWASDWPFVRFEDQATYAQSVAWLFDWVPDAQVRDRILVDTPRELFHF
jgi:predicted TIM-barrel fold metal-dependent hydrolase